MKKNLFVLIILIINLGSVFCADNKERSLQKINIEAYEKQVKNCYYSVDPRFELFEVACRLAGYTNYIYKGDNSFLNQSDFLFAQYKNHNFIKLIKEYKEIRGWSSYIWAKIAFYVSSDFTFYTKSLDYITKDLLDTQPNLKIKTNELEKILNLFNAFAVETKFEKIWIMNSGFYLQNLAVSSEFIEDFYFKDWFNYFFYDEKYGDIKFVITRQHPGMINYLLCNIDGKRTFVLEGNPSDDLYTDFSSLAAIYLNDYVFKNWDAVKVNFTKIQKEIKKINSPEKEKEIEKSEINMNEYKMAMAMYLYCSYLKFVSERQTEAQIKRYGDMKQVYENRIQLLQKTYGQIVNKIINLFEEYEQNRTMYPNIECFCDRINETVNSLKVE